MSALLAYPEQALRCTQVGLREAQGYVAIQAVCLDGMRGCREAKHVQLGRHFLDGKLTLHLHL